MELPLDKTDEVPNAELTLNPKRKAAIYIGIMFLGEIIVKYLLFVVIGNMVLKNLFSYLIQGALMSLGIIFGIVFIVELARFLLYKRKQRLSNKILPAKDPLWFQIIESGFALWILSVVAIVGMAIYTYS